MLPPPAHVVVVHDDYGGDVAKFAARVGQYLKRGVTVRIEGECASSCTMVLAVPSDRICVGSQADLEFHQAFIPQEGDVTFSDATHRSEAGTRILMHHYPKRIRAWIARNGGLTAHLISLKGDELRRMFKACW